VKFDYPSWDEIRTTLWTKGKQFPLIERDMPTFLGCPHATRREELEGADVVIIGSPYFASWEESWAGVSREDWLAAPKRVRQQSARYTGYLQEFDVELKKELRIVDYGDAEFPPEAANTLTADVVLRSQAAIEAKVNDALDAGAMPVVIGQNSPCGSYAIAKCVSEHASGRVGIVSLDTHWDIQRLDTLTMDPRVAGAASWLYKTFEFQANMSPANLIEIGVHGMTEEPENVRDMLERGATMITSWDVKRLGMDEVCSRLDPAYDGTESVYAHFDMDVIGGEGPAPGDILKELAEPIGMSEYEVLRIAYDVGRRGCAAFSFICIPPGSAAVYRLIVHVIAYVMAGKVVSARGGVERADYAQA
jgi:agmatinase